MKKIIIINFLIFCTVLSLNAENEPNDWALNANTLAVNGSETGSMSATDVVDWWKIIITTDGQLRINTTSENAVCVGAYLFDQDSSTELTNNHWLQGIYCSDTSKTLEYSLVPGTYYIKCIYHGGAGSYTITSTLILPIFSNDAEPNNLPADAIVLALNDSLSGHVGYYGNSTTDTEDWYKVTTTAYGRLIGITLTQYSLCVGAYLYATDTTTELTNNYWLYNIYCSDTNKTMFTGLIPPGTYFIKCRREVGYGSYRLKNIFEPKVKSQFICTGSINTFSFTNTTINGSSFTWDFGDGTTSNLVNPQHTYQEPGVYNVCLIATNAFSADTFCNYVSIKGIKNVVTNKAGNTGDATVYVYGGGFTNNTSFKLTRSGYPDITGDTTIIPCVGAIRTRFDLRSQPVGMWDVVVNIPGDTIMTLVNGFTIEQGVAADPWVDIIGRDRIVFNRNQTYTIAYGNNGNVDASGVPLWIVVQNEPGITVSFEGFEVELPKVAIDSGWTAIEDSIPIFYDMDSLFGEPFNARIYGFYIPIIPAGQTESVKMIIKSDQDLKVMAWVNPPYFQSPMSTDYKTCVALAAGKLLASGIGLISPIDACVHSVVTNYIYDPWSYKQPQPQTPKTWGSSLWNLATTGLSCAGAFVPMGIVLNWAVNLTNLAADFSSAWDAASACKDAYGMKSRKDKSIRAVSSLDPNEIYGPTGYAAANYSIKNANYAYTIYFENMSTASAPAQEVIVSDTLNMADFDISNFSFGQISFGDTLYVPVPNQREFTTDIDLRPGKNLIVRTDARLDTVSGIITWHFLSLDPATMALTEDPMEGFLPPNISSPEGEGSVSFSTGLKPSLTHGTQIKNKASIVFDMNPAIVTNEWLNTLDITVPQSSVNILNNIIYDTAFQVQWGGIDVGCGVRNYSVFVSENDSDYYAWKSYTSEISAMFTGDFGSTYKFYSIAYDSLGLTETTPSVPDAYTQLQLSTEDLNQNPFSLNIYPNPANHQINIVFTLPEAKEIKIEIRDLQGRLINVLKHGIMQSGTHSLKLNTENINSGIYFISFRTEYGSTRNKFIIIK